MRLLRRLWALLSPSRRDAIERDVDEEIRFHLEMRTRDNIDRGMDRDEARSAALRSFGGTESVRRAGRDLLAGAPGVGGGGGRLAALGQDARSGFRMLARHRVVAAAAIVSLALGIGANTANFSVVYGVLFRELPFADGDRIFAVDAWNPARGDGDAPITWADLEALRDAPVFEEVGAFTDRSFTVTGGDRPERVAGASVTPGLFAMLGVQPQRGRLFRDGEGAEAGFETVALISDGLWRRAFGAEPGIVGETLHLNGRELVIVGVMPPGFRFPEREDLWVPLGTENLTDHRVRYLFGVAKTRPGVRISAARQAVAAWEERAAREFPETHRDWQVRIQPYRHLAVDAPARRALYLLLAAVGFVLLLACANVANLLLAQATERRRELVVRAALGASRLRLARQTLAGSLLLGLAGGGLGFVVARVWVGALAGAIPEEMTFWVDLRVDGVILLYTLAITVATALLFGLLPALQASRAGLGGDLRQAGRGTLDGGGGRLRRGLVVVEVALSLLLVVGAALMMGSFLRLQTADPGFHDGPLLSFRVMLAGDRYDDRVARAAYFSRVGERLGALPGAVAAVATGAIPADDGGAAVSVVAAGGQEDEALYATAIPSTRGLFEVIDVPLIAGRDFSAGEVMDPEADVAIVGETLARRLWPGRDPIGRRLEIVESGALRVIGVAPDLQYEEFGEALEATKLQIHFPYGPGGWRGMAVLVRAAGEPVTLIDEVRAELARIDPGQAPYDILTMRDRRFLTTWEQGVFGLSFGIFGLIALTLALCGVYGVIAYSVAQRTREMGVRMALGAAPGRLGARVILEAVGLAAAGVGVGLLVTWPFVRALQGILYGVDGSDPLVFGAVAGLLMLAAALASWAPARRAASVDPITALRVD